MADLTAIVVSHNSIEHLERCLDALDPRSREVVVVDSGSTDGSPELVRKGFPGAHLVDLGANVGYGAAANAAIESTSGELVLVMNADAWPAEGAVDGLANAMLQDDRLGAVGPALVGLDGRPQASLVPFPSPWWLGTPAITSAPPRRPPAAPGDRPSFLVGAAVLLRRAALEDVGPFDPSFFMFNEDVDLCWRLHRRGWGIALVPDAVFVHVGGASTSRTPVPLYLEQVRGHLLLLAKHRGAATAERARRYLGLVLRLRALGADDERAAYFAAATAWLASPAGRDAARGGAAAESRPSRPSEPPALDSDCLDTDDG